MAVVVSSPYVIKYCGVALKCRKLVDNAGGIALNMRTEIEASVKGGIRAAFGSAVVRDLVKLKFTIDGIGVNTSGIKSIVGLNICTAFHAIPSPPFAMDTDVPN